MEPKGIGSSRSIGCRMSVVVRSSPLCSEDLKSAECSASVILRLCRSNALHIGSSYWDFVQASAAAVVGRLGAWNSQRLQRRIPTHLMDARCLVDRLTSRWHQ